MGQKVNPIGYRLALTRDWRSRWYANPKEYPDFLHADLKIRQYVKKKLQSAAVAKIVIERAWNSLRVTIFTARPGIVIGRKGAEIEKMTEDITKMSGGKSVKIDIQEIKTPELEAQLVAENIALQLERRNQLPPCDEEGRGHDDGFRRAGHQAPRGGPSQRRGNFPRGTDPRRQDAVAPRFAPTLTTVSTRRTPFTARSASNAGFVSANSPLARLPNNRTLPLAENRPRGGDRGPRGGGDRGPRGGGGGGFRGAGSSERRRSPRGGSRDS